MIVVTTPTGQIGSQLVRQLLDQDKDVRVVVRDASRLDDTVRRRVETIDGSHDDPAVLDKALPGAEALSWLVPPNPRAPSAEEHYLGFARTGAAAIARHDVGHEELGRPVAYRRVSMDDYASLLRARGADDQAIKDVTEAFAAQDHGIYDADWATAKPTSTDFRTWCREVLKPAADARA
ncbi:NAD(P)H-binding protein [Microbispora sp. H10836]|uniref:NAD(P)H-binding protein n=1 Tax=Microbispora sp. H10836 TaxID=2729106 RepID=UPI0014745DE1|nr:NAD(P)H-binding protein [Microbispora sp. H10836]